MKMTFIASLDELHNMLAFIRGETAIVAFEGLIETQIELALEEALVNIIKHGYKQYSGVISIECLPIDQGITVVLSDTGLPFNPCLASSQEISEKKDFPPSGGGYGIYLIRTIMDRLDYQYCDGCNVFSMTKFLSKESV